MPRLRTCLGLMLLMLPACDRPPTGPCVLYKDSSLRVLGLGQGWRAHGMVRCEVAREHVRHFHRGGHVLACLRGTDGELYCTRGKLG